MPKKIYKLKTDNTPKNLKIDYASELNPEQLKVVREAEGPCLVLAGAGSGKTRTLVYRVAYLLEHGVKPENILLMTFTNKAAKEMISRVEQLLKYRPQGLWAGTFHHIGNRILRQHIKKLGYNSNYTIIDEQDAKELLQKVITDLDLGKKHTPPKSPPYQGGEVKGGYFPKAAVIKNIISLSINSGQSIDKILSKKYSYLDKSLLKPIKQVATAYESKKRKLNNLDYDDLLVLWLRLLREQAAVKKSLAAKFYYILVDEYQDTNYLQAQIVEQLTAQHGNVLVVGDDAQSIYSFRAADIGNILSFPKKFTGTNIFKLETNYRSTPQILDLANDSIKNNLDQFPKHLQAVKTDGERPILIPLQNNDQQADFITQRVLELHNDGLNLTDMAVLFRADYHALELELNLNKKNIPYVKRGGLKFFEQAHLKDILAFAKIIYNPSDEIAWNRILNLQTGIGRSGAQKIISSISGLNLTQIAKLNDQANPSLTRAWLNFRPVMEKLATVEKTKIAELIEVVTDDFYTNYAKTTYDNADKRLEDIEQLINFADQYRSLEQFLSDTTLSENFRSENTARGENTPADYLILTTIHQAKGLEWPVVFVISLASGQFPHAKAMDTQAEFEEERRLFYVATTRAKQQLYLTYPLVAYNHTYGLIFTQPSEFIQELNDDLYDEWQIEGDNNGENVIEYLPDV